MINTLYSRLISWSREREFRKLSKLDRYTPTSISFLGSTLFINDSVTFLHSRTEVFINEGYKFESPSEEPLIIDCGSNIGLSVIYFKKIYPKCKIIAFEPDPDLYKTLVSNIASYKLNDIKAVEAACWTEDGFLSFQKEGAHSGSLTNFWDASKTIQVRTEKLERYVNQPIDLLKMDIEGAEYEVLMSIKPYLKNIRNIVFEYHSSRTSDQKLSDLLDLLKEAGFRYHIKEAFTRKRPLYDRDLLLNMDLQLNVYGVRE